MNPTDNVAISALFAEAKVLNEMKEKASAPYVNVLIRDYALAVWRNHDRIRKELIDSLMANRHVLGDKVQLDADCYLTGRIEKIILSGCKIGCRLHLTDYSDFIVKSSYCSHAQILVPSKNIVVEDMWWHTSDTSDPDYKICSAWALHNHSCIQDDNGRYRNVTMSDIEHGRFTEKEWRQIYCLATWTESYTKKFAEHFKNFISERVAMLRGSVNSDLEAKKKNESVANRGTHTTTINITWTI
jgi:hypothetical protein